MGNSTRRFFCFGAAASGFCLAAEREPSALPAAPFLKEKGWTPLLNARNLAGWHGPSQSTGDWFTATSASLSNDDASKRLRAVKSPGGTIVNGSEKPTVNLLTDAKHGDIELYLEFLLAKGSNSGVYLQSLYEIQIFDSYAKAAPLKYSDAGGLYERAAPDGKGFGGFPPRSNASRAPGQWQSYLIRFHAPRFDGSGAKTADARFESVIYNGVTVHENVACDGPTRSASEVPEAPLNSLMLQGDHGPVAFRNIYMRPLSGEK